MFPTLHIHKKFHPHPKLNFRYGFRDRMIFLAYTWRVKFEEKNGALLGDYLRENHVVLQSSSLAPWSPEDDCTHIVNQLKCLS